MLVLLITCSGLAPIAAYSMLTTLERSAEVAPEATVWVPAQPNTDPIRRQISVALSWAPADEVFAPSWSGLTEEVDVVDRSSVTHGQRIAVIGGIARLAVHTPRPFARELGLHATGPDAAQLNSFLHEAGFSAGVSDRVTSQTITGIKQLAASLGVPDAKSVLAFDPSWFAYIPSNEVFVSDVVALSVGAPAPAAGEPIFIGLPRVTEAMLIELLQDGGSADSAQPNEQYQPLTADVGESLMLGGQALALAGSMDSVDPAEFGLLASLVEPESVHVRAALERPSDDGQWAVPTGSIVVARSGETCVVVESKSGGIVTPVSIVGAGEGVSIVESDISKGDRVLVGPDRTQFLCASD